RAAHLATARPDLAAAFRVELLALVSGTIGVPARLPEAAVLTFALVGALLRAELGLRRHDDAVVVLGMLKVALRGDGVAGRESVARERHVFLGDMRRGAPDLHIGAVRFVVPR